MASDNEHIDAQERIYRAISASNTPVLYSDGVLQYAIGNQVSRIVFGIETRPGTDAAPVITMVIPTEALIAMIDDLSKVVSRPEVRQSIIDAAVRTVQRAESLGD